MIYKSTQPPKRPRLEEVEPELQVKAQAAKKKKRRRKKAVVRFVLVAAALTLVALVAAFALPALLRGREPAGLSALPLTGEAEEGVYIDDYAGAVYSEDSFIYSDERFTAYAEVRRNEYDPEGFGFNGGRMSYTNPETGESALLGIDVSSHQEEIDWQAVKDDGIEFAMIRVGYRGHTEGKLNPDNQFQRNMSGAAAVGIPVGIYFYAQAVDVYEAREEAAWVLEQIAPYTVDYPVVYDWEYVGDPSTRTANTDGLTIDRCAQEFCEIIEEAGYRPMIYFNRELAVRTIDLYRLQKFDFWLAEYNEIPSFFYGFEMLQYSYTGKVDGIKGGVDMNLCFVDYLSE